MTDVFGISPEPMSRQRSDEVKRKVHILCWVSWWSWYFISVIVLTALFNSTQPGTGGAAWLVGAMSACILFLCTLPLILWFGRKGLRDYTASDYPVKAIPGPMPRWVGRDSSHIEPRSILLVDNYPMIPLLDEDWLDQFRFLTDAELDKAKGDMCAQVLHNWAVAHPDAPVSARRPVWFENMDEQAETLLKDLQRCESISTSAAERNMGDAAYFKQHHRWPDSWYIQRQMPVPPPGPDPDWFLSSPASAAVNAAVIVGAVYLGGYRPVKKIIKSL